MCVCVCVCGSKRKGRVQFLLVDGGGGRCAVELGGRGLNDARPLLHEPVHKAALGQGHAGEVTQDRTLGGRRVCVDVCVYLVSLFLCWCVLWFVLCMCSHVNCPYLWEHYDVYAM